MLVVLGIVDALACGTGMVVVNRSSFPPWRPDFNALLPHDEKLGTPHTLNAQKMVKNNSVRSKSWLNFVRQDLRSFRAGVGRNFWKITARSCGR